MGFCPDFTSFVYPIADICMCPFDGEYMRFDRKTQAAMRYELLVDSDTQSAQGHTQWFYFSFRTGHLREKMRCRDAVQRRSSSIQPPKTQKHVIAVSEKRFQRKVSGEENECMRNFQSRTLRLANLQVRNPHAQRLFPNQRVHSEGFLRQG